MLTTVDQLRPGQKFHLPGVPEQVWQLIRVPRQYHERDTDVGYITVTNPLTTTHVPTFCGFRDPESMYKVIVIE